MEFQKKFDIVVAGGGIAGVAAALAAARRGKEVALIEKTAYFGGLATTGIVNVYLPLCDGFGHQVAFGLPEELLLASQKYGPGHIPPNWRNGRELHEYDRYRANFSPASFILALDELLEKAGVEIWFDTVVIGVKTSGDRLRKIVVANKSGIGTIAAKCFVDATGDSDLAAFAGLKCHEAPNAMTSWIIERRRGGESSRLTLDGLIGARIVGANSLFANDLPKGVSGRIVTTSILTGRDVYRKILSGEYAAGTEDRNTHYPLMVPAMATLRHTRCIDAKFALEPGMEWTRFEDSVGIIADWRKPGFVWEIPYRTLLPRKLKGVLAAGRCTAARGDAWEVTRVIPAAALTGEAAGVAAALAVEEKTTPDAVPMTRLANELHKNGVVLHFDDLGLTRPKKNSEIDDSSSEVAADSGTAPAK